MNFNTKVIHYGVEPEPQTGAIMTPIFQTSTYVQPRLGEHKGYEYSRTKNPTRNVLEKNLAGLENGKFGISFSSGCAATSAVMHTLKSGDHVICCDDVYGGTFRLFTKVFSNFGLQFSFVDLTDASKLSTIITDKTKLVWIETPTNPLLKLIDIQKIVAICKLKAISVAVDNTFATPYLQNPLELDADLVVHSTTKYIGGHSDVVGGSIITKSDQWAEKLYFVQNSVGAVPAPFDSFLLLRGVKTLALRMERHCSNALSLAQYLEKKPQIAKVIYPGLSSHPQHSLAKKQMRAFGGMITMILNADIDGVKKFFEPLELFSLAESLGGVESLIEHPAIMTHASIPKEMREKIGIVDGLVRLSVGIENIDDLIHDLDKGLKAIS